MIVTYKHPLHGIQTLRPAYLEMRDGLLHAISKHGATFQTLEPQRIVSIEVQL